MAHQRIRTIKPEFFQHETLFDLEKQSGLPVRLAYCGLWSCCDREGRFRWRPRTLKASILPYDDVDFAAVLEALARCQFIVKYEIAGECYGCVPSWSRHQVINVREAKSVIPPPASPTENDGIAPSVDSNLQRSLPVHARAEVEVELEMERNRNHSSKECLMNFSSEQFLSNLRREWPRPEFGYASEQAAVDAIEIEMREQSITADCAAELILQRIRQIARLVMEWPRERKRMIPGLTNLLRNRKYMQEDCFWSEIDQSRKATNEREQIISRIASGVAEKNID